MTTHTKADMFEAANQTDLCKTASLTSFYGIIACAPQGKNQSPSWQIPASCERITQIYFLKMNKFQMFFIWVLQCMLLLDNLDIVLKYFPYCFLQEVLS